jgi:RimJ/RimL family protein N-acetyltransferase
MMLGITPSDNVKACKLHKHLGFTEIARIKDAYDVGVDQIVFQMLREDCKYIAKLKEVA